MASALDSERMVPPCTTAIANVANSRACIIACTRVRVEGEEVRQGTARRQPEVCRGAAPPRGVRHLSMTEEATRDGGAEIQEAAHSAVTVDDAASTEDAWTQLIGRADIDKAVAAAQPTSGSEGLPWSHEDAWPLSERQLRYLSFELLLLCPPDELETEDDPQDEAPQGEAPASELPTLSAC